MSGTDVDLSLSQEEYWSLLPTMSPEIANMELMDEYGVNSEPGSRKRGRDILEGNDSSPAEDESFPPKHGTSSLISTNSIDVTSISSVHPRASPRSTPVITEPGSIDLLASYTHILMKKPLTPPTKRMGHTQMSAPVSRRESNPAASLPTPQSNKSRVRPSSVDNVLPTLKEPTRPALSSVYERNPPQAGSPRLPERKKPRHEAPCAAQVSREIQTDTPLSVRAGKTRDLEPLPSPDLFGPITSEIPRSRHVVSPSPSSAGALPTRPTATEFQNREIVQLPANHRSAPLESTEPEVHLPQLDSIVDSFTALPTNPLLEDHQLLVRLSKRAIRWGVIWQLYFGISIKAWTAAEIDDSHLDELNDTAEASGPRVFEVMVKDRPSTTGFSAYLNQNPEQRKRELNLFKQLDREDAAECEGMDRNLGCGGSFMGVNDYQGGQITFVIAASLDKRGQLSDFKFQPPEMKRSHRIARELGSRSVIEVRISQGNGARLDVDSIATNIGKLSIAAHVFAPLCAKEDKIFYVEVKEESETALPPSYRGNHGARRTMREIVTTFNELSRNFTQAPSKWAARFDLALSTSVAVLEFDAANVVTIEDEWIAGCDPEKPPAEACLTDGCNLVSRSVMARVQARLGLDALPVDLQGRVGGTKGLYLLHPDDVNGDVNGPFKLWIRKSARKVKLDLFTCSRSHRILDVVATPRCTYQGSLSSQTILNLVHNGVPFKILTALLEQSIKDAVDILMRWDGPHWRALLFDAVWRAGRLSSALLTELSGALARAKGITGRFVAEPQEEDWIFPSQEFVSLEDEIEGSVESIQRDFGAPLSVFQKACALIAAGFDPDKDPYLNDTLRTALKQVLSGILDNFHITVPHSFSAMFLIPDPTKTLKKGQVYINVREAVEDPNTGMKTSQLRGDVLIYRNPTRVASDVQKFEAVDCPELSHYANVIVMAVDTDCERSPASYLGGGDYDGDTAMVIFQPEIVKSFTNHAFVDKPKEVNEKFEKNVETVRDFCTRIGTLRSDEERARKLVRVMLGGLKNSDVGLYSYMHDLAVYMYGYNDKRTVILAHTFCECLDSNKSGMVLKDSARKKDRKEFPFDKPDWMLSRKDRGAPTTHNKRLPPRAPGAGSFILKHLRAYGEGAYDRRLADFQKLTVDKSGVKEVSKLTSDDALKEPFKAMDLQATILNSTGATYHRRELDFVRKHVDACLEDWSTFTWSSANAATTNEFIRKLQRGFAAQPDDTPVDKQLVWGMPASDLQIRASYAYFRAKSAIPKFAWTVAFRLLCEIKAQSLGGSGDMVPEIKSLLSMPRSAVQLLRSQALVTDPS